MGLLSLMSSVRTRPGPPIEGGVVAAVAPLSIVEQGAPDYSANGGKVYGGQGVDGYMPDCESGVTGSLPVDHPI